MRILFTIGSLAGGGAERVVARLANEMTREGHEVYIKMIANSQIEYPIDEKIEVSEVRSKINIRGLRYLSRCHEYKKQVLSCQPDIVVSFTATVNLFVLKSLYKTGIKVVLSERNNPYVDPDSRQLRNKRDASYKRADGFVFQTQDACNYFKPEIRRRSAIILNPLDDSIPSPWIEKREKRIVSVGRLEKQKNHRLLINAFADIAALFPEYVLEIYGEGSLRSSLELQISELHLEGRVILKGYNRQVLDKIQKATLFVLPSDYEGLSNALIEAMAMGLPVISTDHPIGGAREVIKSGSNGILVPVGDRNAMSDAMKLILSDSPFARSIAKEAQDIRSCLSISRITSQWTSFLQNTMERA